MLRSMIRNVAALAVLGLGIAAPQAQAGFSGTFSTGSVTTTSTVPTLGAIASGAAATFTFSNVPFSTNNFFASSGSGDFSTTGGANAVVAGSEFLATNFATNGNNFSFSSTTLGAFFETGSVKISTTIENNVVVGLQYYLSGDYVGGNVGSTETPASFTISFTQAAGSGAISSSGTLTIPPAPVVPEPASVAMLGLGLVALGGYGLRRRIGK